MTAVEEVQHHLGRPTGADSTKTRQRVLDAARDVFMTYGFAGATFKAVAAHVGVTRVAVRYYYTSILDMYSALRAHDVAVRDPALAAAARELSPAARCAAFIEEMTAHPEVRDATAFLLLAEIDRQRCPVLQRDDPEPDQAIRSLLTGADEDADAPGRVEIDTLYALICAVALYSDDAATELVATMIARTQ